MAVKLDARQIISRDTLAQIATAAGTELDDLLRSLNAEVTPALVMDESSPADLTLNIGSIEVANSITSKNHTIPPINGVSPAFTSGTVVFPAASGGAVTITPGNDSTLTVASGNYIKGLIYLDAAGDLNIIFGAEDAVEADAPIPPSVNSTYAIGYVTLYNDGGTIDNVTNQYIYQFAGSGGAGGGGGAGSGGGELVSLLYQADLADPIDQILSGDTPVDTAAGKTDAALYSAANQYIRLSYDADKTVTGTGTANLIISGAPAFTIKAGDIMRIGDEARKITTVNSQTDVDIDVAFTTDPTAADALISQAVHTQDLNAFTAGGTGLAISSQITADLAEVLVGYTDSEADGDIIPDWGSAALIAFDASADGTSWSTPKVRTTTLADECVHAQLPTEDSSLYIRFFANKTSGNGAVNLLDYKTFFHRSEAEQSGVYQYSAFANMVDAAYQNVSHAVINGKSRFTFDFSFGRGLNGVEAGGSALEVMGNGQAIPRFESGVTNASQAYFVEIGDQAIEMDGDYSATSTQFIFRVPRPVIDSRTNNTSRISDLEDFTTEGFNPFVIKDLLNPTDGDPGTGQYRSEIINRAAIMNPANDLKSSVGIERIMTQSAHQLQDEFGPNEQPVQAILNSDERIRFVGEWTSEVVAGGQVVGSTNNFSDPDDFIEIVFYGTGLNLLARPQGVALSADVDLDGVAQAAIDIGSQAIIIANRGYSANIMIPVTSGKALAMHTIKIKGKVGNADAWGLHGIEILNESTQVKTNVGSALVYNDKQILSVQSSLDYKPSGMGSNGGRVVQYLQDNTIGQVYTDVGSPVYLTNADHSNEEVTRTHNFREFGAGRVDDFSTLTTSISDRAFTLDDGTTTLVLNDGVAGVAFVKEDLTINANGGFITLTFVGTGLDINREDSGSGGSDTYQLIVDGGTPIALPTAGDTTRRITKLVSGLPYGTHTVKILRVTAATWSPRVGDFIVYGPKTPSIPSDAMEVCSYNVMADFVANTTQGTDSISTGILRKMGTREILYAGSWTLPVVVQPLYINGFSTYSNTNGATASYTFFGTGFDFRFFGDTNNSADITVKLNDTLATLGGGNNFTTASSSVYGAGIAFTEATGILDMDSSSASLYGCGFIIKDLPLALYTLELTNNTTNYMRMGAIDIITPIHSHDSNIPGNLQNTLSIGSMALSDNRLFSPIENQIEPPNWYIRRGDTGHLTTTTITQVPMDDMNGVIKTSGGPIEINFKCYVENTAAGAGVLIYAYIDGIQVDYSFTNCHAASKGYMMSMTSITEVGPGTHFIKLMYRPQSGGQTGKIGSISRLCTVKELK